MYKVNFRKNGIRSSYKLGVKGLKEHKFGNLCSFYGNLPRNFIGGDKRPMSSKYCGTVLIKQGTNFGMIKKIKRQGQCPTEPKQSGKIGNFMHGRTL